MKTVFDQSTRNELIERVHRLNEHSIAQWGKMTVFQMLKHCIGLDEMTMGKRRYKQVFIGRLFGKMAMRSLLKDEKAMRRNAPTIPDLKTTGDGDIEAEKKKWVGSIQSYANYSIGSYIHPFFGTMNREQTGRFVYKHIDHHLRQFNV